VSSFSQSLLDPQIRGSAVSDGPNFTLLLTLDIRPSLVFLLSIVSIQLLAAKPNKPILLLLILLLLSGFCLISLFSGDHSQLSRIPEEPLEIAVTNFYRPDRCPSCQQTSSTKAPRSILTELLRY